MKKVFTLVVIVVLLALPFQMTAQNAYGTPFADSFEIGIQKKVSTVAVDSSYNSLVTFPLLNGLWNPQFILAETLSDDTSHLQEMYPSALPIVQQWNTTWNKSKEDYGYAVVVDSEDNIIITGFTGNMTYPYQETDAFLVKYSEYGVLLWNVTWNKSQIDYGLGVTVDSEDNIIITGLTGNITDCLLYTSDAADE